MIHQNLFDCCLIDNLSLIKIKDEESCNWAYSIDNLFDTCLIRE